MLGMRARKGGESFYRAGDKWLTCGARIDSALKAQNAEGVPCSGGYHEQYFDGLLDEAINSRGFKRLFSAG